LIDQVFPIQVKTEDQFMLHLDDRFVYLAAMIPSQLLKLATSVMDFVVNR
jgi:hypothetical protein